MDAQSRLISLPRRCLTLVETMIAIILLLAMGALIFPSLMDSLDERQFETAADITNEQLVLARAHAQATGKPVEVSYNVKTSEVEARLFLPNHEVFAGLTSRPQNASADAKKSEKSSAGEISELWAKRLLGRGLRLQTRQPIAENQEFAQEFNEDEYVETLENLGRGQDVRLAIFMPDGSALMGEEFWLNDESGRVGVFTINPWSGLPLFKRLADLRGQMDEVKKPQETTD